MTKLAKTETVLEFDGRIGGLARLTTDESPLHALVPVQTWEDMGRPDRVTVTIEPGDNLNP